MLALYLLIADGKKKDLNRTLANISPFHRQGIFYLLLPFPGISGGAVG